MNNIGKYLAEQLIKEIENITDYVVVYSGRFQPFHKGHFLTYQNLVKKFGKNNVYIGTSDKTDKLKSPFNFKEKETIMTKMFGIPSNRIVQIKNPYAPTEILKNFDETTTAFITVVGEKDGQRLGGKYFTPYKGDLDSGYKDKGYVYVSPSLSNVSGTDVRNWLGKGEIEDRKKLFNKAYPKFDEKIFNLITTKLSSLNESGGIDSGEPETAFYVDGSKRIINGAKPEIWFKQGGYTQLDKPKSDFMRGKGKNKDTESQFRKVTYALKGVTAPKTDKEGKSKIVPYQVDKWKNVTPKNVKKKEDRYWDLDKVNEGLFIPKEFIEKWISENLNQILSEISTSTAGPATNAGKIVDDGPNLFFPNFDTFDTVSKERAEQIGYTVFKQIMSGELEDYYEHPIYPNGPVKAVSTFPSGVISNSSSATQKDMDGDDAYDKWYKHVTRSMALVGYQLVKDFDKSFKDLAIQSADNIKKVADVEKLKESGMGLAMGYPSKEQLLQKKRERDKLRAQMDRESEYYEPIDEDITIPINVGDTVLGGKFKNKKIVVKDIGKNEKGDITINGKPLLKYRLIGEVYDEVIAELIKDPQFERLLSEIPMDDLEKIDKFADTQLNPFDVVLTGRHFMDRLIDPRNKKPISSAELIGFFKRLSRKKNEFADFLKKYGEIVAKDNRTKINIPFMKQANKAIAKTIMRKDDFKTPSPELKFEAASKGNMYEPKRIKAYYEALCKSEGITPLPVKFEAVGKGGAATTYNSKTMKPLYISFNVNRMMDPEFAIIHELTHQIKLETEGDAYVGKRDQTAKFKKLENRLIDKYVYSKYSKLLYENRLNEDTVKHITKSLGVSRKDMPQINSKDVGEFVKYLKDKGVSVSSSVINVSKVGMTQKDINVDKVRDLLGVEKANLAKPVIISKDNYILDGHHRVAALYNIDKDFRLKTIQVDLGIGDLLKTAKGFPKVSYKNINESSDISPLGGGNNSARWTPPGKAKTLGVEQLSGYTQTDFPIADSLDISGETDSWIGQSNTAKYHNKVKAKRDSSGNLVLERKLNEGGAYGHMNHPFDIDINLTFGQLKDIVKKALNGELELTREKCIAGDTVIHTEKNGDMTIAEFVDNNVVDKVLSFNEETGQNEYMDVMASFNNDTTEEWLEIELEDGKTIQVTPNHRMYVEGIGYVEAKDLTEDMELKIV